VNRYFDLDAALACARENKIVSPRRPVSLKWIMRPVLLLGLAASVAIGTVGCSDDGDDAAGTSDKADTSGQDVAVGGELQKGWKVVDKAFADGAFLSVWCGAKSTWVVGGEKHRSVALRFDGKAWKRLDPPVKQQLWWVHGIDKPGGETVVVVGESGAIAMYDEATWTVHDSKLPGATLFGAWGTAKDDLWGVGGPWQRAPKTLKQAKRVLLHFDGKSWERVDVDKVVGTTVQSLFKVWGTAKDNVYVVGDGATVLHYDGASWSKEDSGLVGVVLFTLNGRGADDVWAVGGFGQGQLIHRTGGKWASVDIGENTPAALQGVWTGAKHPVWISGWDGYTASWDGTAWTEYSTGTDHALHAIAVDPSGRVWSVGGNITTLRDDHDGSIVVFGADVPKP